MGRSRVSRGSGPRLATLEPRVSYVSRDVIKKRWKKLSANSQDSVRDLLQTLEQQAKTTKGRRTDANDDESCVGEVTRRLIERLPRMPFPSSTAEEAFDFEMTLHRSRHIEEQLTTNTHSMTLLKEQITREERILESERKEAERLEQNLKNSDALRYNQARNLHPIAQKLGETHGDLGGSVTPALQSQYLHRSLDLRSLTADSDISSQLDQLRNHLNSMQSNAAVMQTVITTMKVADSEIRALHGSGRA